VTRGIRRKIGQTNKHALRYVSLNLRLFRIAFQVMLMLLQFQLVKMLLKPLQLVIRDQYSHNKRTN